MSNNSAIAAVTATLKDLLDKGLADASFNHSGVTRVTALAPGLLKSEDENGLNLFLYQIAPNPGHRNVNLPERDERDDRRVGNPPLALDLYYILIAYGKQDFESELLLGRAMQIMHEYPVLTRETINSALSNSASQTELNWPLAADLADQAVLVRVTQQPMPTEEMFKLWLAFQAAYRPSVAYMVSVVLIDSPHR